MSRVVERTVRIESGDLSLEGAMHDGEGSLAAVIMHPHPLYGGDMDNHVVLALRSALAGVGAATLRFNFRGAGRSEGSHDGGRGEAVDARAAVALMRREAPRARLVLCGYSFGAMIAAAVAKDVSPAAIVLVSPPLAYGVLPDVPDGVPALVTAGDRDPVAPADAVRALVRDRVTVIIVAGVDHGWWPGADELGKHASAFLTSAGLV